jgi:hypothetical protein
MAAETPKGPYSFVKSARAEAPVEAPGRRVAGERKIASRATGGDDLAVGLDRDRHGAVPVTACRRGAEVGHDLAVLAEARVEAPIARMAGKGKVPSRQAGGDERAVALNRKRIGDVDAAEVADAGRIVSLRTNELNSCLAERRRSRTYRAVGYTTAAVLKTAWATGPMPLRGKASSVWRFAGGRARRLLGA